MTNNRLTPPKQQHVICREGSLKSNDLFFLFPLNKTFCSRKVS